MGHEPEDRDSRREEWRSPEAVASRARVGWAIAVFIVLLFVVPVIAKYLQWF